MELFKLTTHLLVLSLLVCAFHFVESTERNIWDWFQTTFGKRETKPAANVTFDITKCGCMNGIRTHNGSKLRSYAYIDYATRQSPFMHPGETLGSPYLRMLHKSAQYSQNRVTLPGYRKALKGIDVSSCHNSIDGFGEDCGLGSRVSTRIVGGERVSILHQPWMVGLQVYGYQGCGGALINRYFVLTASHCFKKVSNPSDITAILGTNERYDFNAKRMPVFKIHRHPEYRPNRTYCDICLLEFETPVEFTPHIQPVCLPRVDESYLGKSPTVIGFGFEKENGFGSNYLNEVEVTVIDHDKCAEIYKKDAHIYEQNMCAGGDKGKDACLGDSGSPLILKEDERSTIIGSVSWGIGCAREGMPGVYTRTAAFLPWIQSVINKNDTCPNPPNETTTE